LGNTGVISSQEETGFGIKFAVRGKIFTPTGRHMSITTIWIIKTRTTKPIFVTAYPLKNLKEEI